MTRFVNDGEENKLFDESGKTPILQIKLQLLVHSNIADQVAIITPVPFYSIDIEAHLLMIKLLTGISSYSC